MFVKTNIGLQTPSHHPPEIHDQPSPFCHKVNKFSKGRTFSPIISMRGHEWVNIDMKKLFSEKIWKKLKKSFKNRLIIHHEWFSIET